MQNQIDTLLQAMRDALEKLERAIQLPSRKEFESMTARVGDLSRRLDEIEERGGAERRGSTQEGRTADPGRADKNGPKRKAARKTGSRKKK